MAHQNMKSGFILKIIQGEQAGTKKYFNKNTVTIGRETSSDFHIQDNSISNKHVRIIKDYNKYYIEDLESTNGVYYENQKLKPHSKVEISDGKAFSLGKIIIKFLINEQVIQINEVKSEESKLGTIGYQSWIQKPINWIIIGLLFFLILLFGLKKIMDRSTQKNSEKQIYEDLSAIPIKLEKYEDYIYEYSNPNNEAKKKHYDKIIYSSNKDKVFGYTPSKSDKTHPDKVIFTFYGESKIATIYFECTGINDKVKDKVIEHEVVVTLNNKHLFYIPIVLSGWQIHNLRLPIDNILIKQTNNIVFDNLFNSYKNIGETWAISNISISFIVGHCNQKESKYFFKLADQNYKQRHLSLENLFLSYINFQKAISFVQSCPTDQDLLNTIEERLIKVSQELDNKYQKLKFKYYKLFNTKNYKEALEVLEDILSRFPYKKDRRYKEAKKNYNKIKKYFY